MSWRDRLQQASFRGARFHVMDHDTAGGRRVANHEYPQRDKPYTEDLGRKQRQYTLTALVIGEHYMAARDNLIRELEKPGAGTLVHPWLGRLSVVVNSYKVVESTREGGQARFTLNCVESGKKPAPSASRNTAREVSIHGNRLGEVAAASFSNGWQTTHQTASVLEQAENDIQVLSTRLHLKERELIGMVSQPGELAQRLVNDVANVVSGMRTTADALKRLVTKPVKWPLSHAADRHQVRLNQYHLNTLVNVATLAAIARDSANLTWASLDEALAFLTSYTTATNALVESLPPALSGQPSNSIDDASYRALLDCQAAVTADIQARSLKLPRIRQVRINQTTPSLVVAWQLQGNLDREQDIVERNHIKRPGFVPSGTDLQVLS